MAGKRQAQKAVTREKLLGAATTCFRTLGYERATVRDIANTAGVSTGAVFSQFKDKAGLYKAIHGHAPVPPEVGAGLLNVVRRALASGETLYGFDTDMAAGLVARIDEA